VTNNERESGGKCNASSGGGTVSILIRLGPVHRVVLDEQAPLWEREGTIMEFGRSAKDARVGGLRAAERRFWSPFLHYLREDRWRLMVLCIALIVTYIVLTLASS
jgi:hypothetical protein